ncbi:protein-lysine N-methyltransferase efm4 isoform X2 [Vanessa cardui]|uniref:protein-lysine N-methyltransferase efm4 isoform X2 n=1 Tax=Vanessa cardui TaxID=171605 RepID=UPI001F141BD1|nr:protein-lysine N-methyltransferase efm4 isoform X2 [Vanessa cardui]
MEDAELDSSELGTHSYWQQAYIKEINNFEENGDPGDVWFGEDSAMRIVNWICKCGIDKDTAIIDLGCGNGYTLSELAREGFTNLLGIDYCPEAIILAEKVAKSEFPDLKFQMPTNRDEWLECSKEFEKLWHFPHVIGAIDGKHILIQCPFNSGAEYYNYKSQFSIVLLALVDAQYNFMYVHIGTQGRISDGGVLQGCSLKRMMNEKSLNLP